MSGMKFNLLIRNIVKRADGRAAGVVVVKLPCGDRPISAHASACFNDSRRAEVSPGEFLLARPDQLHRFTRSFGQSRSFNGRLTSVLASVAGAGVGHDDTNALFGNTKRLSKVPAHPKWPLRACR